MEIKCIAIVGAGDLGRRLACACLLAGYQTVLEDISPATLEQGIAWIVRSVGDEASREKIDPAVFIATLAKLCIAKTAEDACREADLIIETVADEIEMKIELFTIFDRFAKPGAVFASTTSTLSIADLAEVTFCPERCIGMRFFAEGERLKQVGLVVGRETSDETVAACSEAGLHLAKEVAIIRDEQRFATGCPERGATLPTDPLTKT